METKILQMDALNKTIERPKTRGQNTVEDTS
jgi:hypothetical protein